MHLLGRHPASPPGSTHSSTNQITPLLQHRPGCLHGRSGARALKRHQSIHSPSLSGGWTTLSNLPCGPLLHADPDAVVADEAVWRHDKVCRCRDVFENPPCKIEHRTVARTEKSAGPIFAEPRCRARGQPCQRHTAKMRADTDQYQRLRFDRPIQVCGVLRLLACDSGVWIGKQWCIPLELRQHRRRATQDPDRLATPFHRQHLSIFELADIDVHRSGTRQGARTCSHTQRKRHSCNTCPNSTQRRRGHQ